MSPSGGAERLVPFSVGLGGPEPGLFEVMFCPGVQRGNSVATEQVAAPPARPVRLSLSDICSPATARSALRTPLSRSRMRTVCTRGHTLSLSRDRSHTRLGSRARAGARASPSLRAGFPYRVGYLVVLRSATRVAAIFYRLSTGRRSNRRSQRAPPASGRPARSSRPGAPARSARRRLVARTSLDHDITQMR
jgi:hypothetical protein